MGRVDDDFFIAIFVSLVLIRTNMQTYYLGDICAVT